MANFRRNRDDEGHMPRLRVGQMLHTHPNPWALPGMPIPMEGPWTAEDEEAARKEVTARRAAWTPPPEAWVLLDQLSALVGRRVEIQAWNDMMVWSEEFGPYPLEADVVSLDRGATSGAQPSPTLHLRNILVVKWVGDHDGRSYFLQPQAADTFSMRVADLCSVTLRRRSSRPRR